MKVLVCAARIAQRATNLSLTHIFPRWINKRLQRYGERLRSWLAKQEPEENMPFPYNDATYLEAYCLNRKFAEPDFESYWKRQQEGLDLAYAYRYAPLLGGKAESKHINDSVIRSS